MTRSIAIETIQQRGCDQVAQTRADVCHCARTPVSQGTSKDRIFAATVHETHDGAVSFESLVIRHEAGVRRLAHRLLGWDAAAVDDIVQDVFLAALQSLHRLRGEATIGTWLATVTLNRCRTYRRRQLLRWGWREKSKRLSYAAGGGAGARESAAPDAASPAARACGDETSQAVRAAVRALGARDREVIVLFYLEELSVAEIATILNASRGAVDVRLHRARQKLKPMLADFV
jgi:RNA polymerase sigma-70 factor (ECF subfamily)